VGRLYNLPAFCWHDVSHLFATKTEGLAMFFSQPTLHPNLITTDEQRGLVRGKFEALTARRPTLGEKRLAAGARIPIPLTTVSAAGSFDSYILVQFPNPGSDPTMAALLVDSGNTVMVVPHAGPLVDSGLYAFLGSTTEPWGCPAYLLKGPLQIPTADGRIYEIPDCVFYACYADNPNNPTAGRTANFGTGRIIPWPTTTIGPYTVTVQSPLSYGAYQFAEFIYAPAASMFSPSGELKVAESSQLILNSYMPSGYTMMKIIPNLGWMSVVPAALTVGGTATGWPGDVASPIAMVDTGGGPVFLSDPNGYVYRTTWPDTVTCPTWTQSPDLPSQNCNCVSDSLQIALAGADGAASYSYTVDTSTMPPSVQGLTAVMCQVNGFMMGQQGMNVGGLSALFNRILIEYAGGRVGLAPNGQV
jgi:hypothetical protein